jgi:hypothetical protein
MSRGEKEALYGGAAGGGKSDALLAEALRQVHVPHYRALILRKTYPQLSALIDRSRELYTAAFPKAKYNETKHVWRFESGAKIIFGSLQHLKDRYNYQGQAYDFIGFDELTHFLWDEYSYLFSRNRPTGSGTRVYIRATANPGGIGHGWVKERFITAGKPRETIWTKVKYSKPNGDEGVQWHSRVFIPATIFDNPILLNNDAEYIANLASLPEAEKRALMYGDWDSFSGQVFLEWRNNIDNYDERHHTHVITPFKIPETWRLYRSFDWGFAKPFSVGWYAVDHDNRLYRIRELYGCTGTPDVGVKWEPAEIARQIKRIESEDENLKGRSIIGICDPAIFQENGGDSIATIMERERVYWDKGDHSRIPGKMQIHNRLAMDDEGKPMLYVFSTCKHCIRTLPSLVYSDTDVEDVDTKQEDHIYDELRYVCMANPINPPIKVKEPKGEEFDPLSSDNVYVPYSFGMRYIGGKI